MGDYQMVPGKTGLYFDAGHGLIGHHIIARAALCQLSGGHGFMFEAQLFRPVSSFAALFVSAERAAQKERLQTEGGHGIDGFTRVLDQYSDQPLSGKIKIIDGVNSMSADIRNNTQYSFRSFSLSGI
jgi:hypothetical protein